MIFKARTWLGLGAILVLAMGMPQVQARDAAFLEPSASGAGANDEAVKVEPKGDIDTGESILNVARRTTIFFVNQTNQPVQVEKVAANSDGNVVAEIANNDCIKQATIPAQSRCSVEVSVTPSTPGTWSVDILMTHSGAGRIARSKLTGKTLGTTATTERKDTGLALSTKDISPVSFGDVEVGAKAVRSALMVNDSPETITLYAIDVIEAENGLQRLEQGCAIDMELKPGESCPVTLVWTPVNGGQVSTDLIIRHSGRLGFAVIPIRGNAKGLVLASSSSKDSGKGAPPFMMDNPKSVPPPPTAQDLERATAERIPSVSANALAAAVPMGALRLIGTVGTRAVLLKPDGTTAVVSVGEEFDAGERKCKLLSLTAKSASLTMDGKKKELILGAAPELTSHATQSKNSNEMNGMGGMNSTAMNASGFASPSGLGSTLGAPLAAPASAAPIPTVTPLIPPTGGAK